MSVGLSAERWVLTGQELNGDQMRDMGHALTGVLDSALPFDGQETP